MKAYKLTFKGEIMNREIKFRVWDKDLKKMRYLNSSHDFICFDEKGNGYYHNMQTGLGEWFSDLMQYTGLKDKNGVEIYEGDLIEYKDSTGKYIEEVKFDKGCFYAGLHGGSSTRVAPKLINARLSKVIGNIYEKEVD